MSQDYAILLQKLGSSPVNAELLSRLNNLGHDNKDQLTGLLDHRSFTYHLNESLASCASNSVVAVSVDHIQELNLISGWVIGDIALCSFASFLEKPFSQRYFVGRISGTTFMAFFDTMEGRSLRNWLQDAASHLAGLKLPGVEMLPHEKPTFSAGVFINSGGDKNAEICMLEAKKRLDYARGQGGGGISFLAADQAVLDASTLSLAVKIRKTENEPWHDALIDQLSLNGLTFDSSIPCLVREDIHLHMSNGPGKGAFTTVGEVVWRKPSEHKDPKLNFRIGIRFKSLDKQQRELLENLITGGCPEGQGDGDR